MRRRERPTAAPPKAVRGAPSSTAEPAVERPSIALLANADSGSGDAADVERLLRGGTADVRRFALDDEDGVVAFAPARVVVAGGDGSVGRGAALAARRGVPLGVVPVGTANDFARALELPDALDQAVAVAAAGTRTRPMDLGRAAGRPFVNAASAGLSPVAAQRAEGLKRRLGSLAYAVGAVRAGLGADPIGCRVVCDGVELYAGRVWQVTVACTGAFGGGSEVAADPHDGVLDVVVIEAGSRVALMRRAYGLRLGRVERQPGVLTGAGARVDVETDGTTGFNIDGESVAATALSFTVERHAFEVVVG
jgi:diacylglycerol kinase (ATP)